MRQQPQVVMHINQAFCPVCIQVVSLYTVDEAIDAPHLSAEEVLTT
jgi:hypothetical protein